ncbi:MAG: DUF3164 family protein [Bacteroidota bacterium]
MKKKIWIDEAGNVIPAHRITQTEKTAEKHADYLLNLATKANELLKVIKTAIQQCSTEVYNAVMTENGVNVSARKGNFTWYNFNRSIKIEVAISEMIVFDDVTITACREKLMQFLKKSLTSTQEFIKELIMDAFQTSAGKLDTKKIMYLLKYEDKINDPLYSEAMELLKKSVRKPSKKTYFRIWKRNSSGEYENIDLNFSSL